MLTRFFRNPPIVRLAVFLTVLHLAVTFHKGLRPGDNYHSWYPDASEYLTLASHVAVDGHFTLDGVNPSARREPGYVAFVAAFIGAGIVRPYDLSFANLWPVYVAQILLYGAAAYGLAKFTTHRFGPAAGLLALLFVQGFWELFLFQHLLGNEGIVVVALAGAWLVPGDWERMKRSWPALLGSAALLGYACLTKSIFVLAVPLFAIFIWWRGRVPALRSAVYAAVVLVMPLAWTARNYHHFGLPIMGSIDGVSSLYRGNVLPFTQIPSPDKPEMPEEARQALGAMTSDVERYQWYKERAMQIIREHPVRYALQCLNRIVNMVANYDVANLPAWRALLLFKNAHFMVMLMLALYLPSLLRESRKDFFLEATLFMFIATLLLYGLVYGETRYMMPWMFMMAPFYGAVASRLIVEPLLLRLTPAIPSVTGSSETCASLT